MPRRWMWPCATDAWATLTEAGHAAHPGNTLFRVPHKLDFQHLVPVETIERDGVTMLRLPERHWRHRDGFGLTDPRHERPAGARPDELLHLVPRPGKDSCSKGLKDRKTGAFQKSVFGVTLAGCPLDEKISEMHPLRAEACVLGAFAAIAIDNPMMAATGHRICNDCMKACIYQKQDPVDIPQAETSILRDVLALPWGFEIYALLTRWNPLDIRRPLPRPDTGRKVLVVGLGPAGFTLAHHLMNDGHTVVAIDGLKIEPLGFDPATPGSRRGRAVRRTSTIASWRVSAASPSTASPCAGTRTTSSSCACCWSAARSSRCSAACGSAAERRSRSTTPGRWASTISRSAWARDGRRCSIFRTGSRAACVRRATSSWRCNSPARRKCPRSPTCRFGCRWWSSAAA